MEIVVRPLPPEDPGGVEIVEHKGAGHPDTMCDALAEAFGISLGNYYTERFGTLLHFNVDKALLVGGASRPAFGGGEVLEPMRMLFAGRATREVRGECVPVDELAFTAARSWVRSHMHALDPDRHVVWDCLVRGGSSDLVDLFHARPHSGPWLANDTSVGAGYAPASELERCVRAGAAALAHLARTRPQVGEDMKIMGVRRSERVSLTVACAVVCGYVLDPAAYAEAKAAVVRAVADAAEREIGREVAVEVNVADDVDAGRVFLTVTGTSAECGDDGQVGRGNRVNGLITPYRPMSLEAAAGKNPVSHIGKIYNVVAHKIAASLVERVPEIASAHCFLLGRIGEPVERPAIVDIRVRPRDHVPVGACNEPVRAIVASALGSLGAVAEEMLRGGVKVF